MSIFQGRNIPAFNHLMFHCSIFVKATISKKMLPFYVFLSVLETLHLNSVYCYDIVS